MPPGENNQIHFATKMAIRYLSEKSASAVGVRRLHYWIVSLPEHERQIPGKRKGEVRTYQNVKNDYQRLSDLLVNARIQGLVPWEAIQDDKNGDPIYMPDRVQAEPAASLYDRNEYKSIAIAVPDTLPDFRQYLSGICIESDHIHPRFVHQSHRLVVVIEKATSKDRLKYICERYGADLLIFSGQFSVTRVNDVVRQARDEDKPIALFYISDLDCAGWYMPEAFFNRINELYPRDDHIVHRVALTRQQAVDMNLPPAFNLDEKGYSEEMKARFCEMSGGDTCVELDALSEWDLISFLERSLSEYAGLEDDRQLSDTVREESAYLCDSIESDLSDILEPYRIQYGDLHGDYNRLIGDLAQVRTEYQERIIELNTRRQVLQGQITSRVEEAMWDAGVAVLEKDVWT